MLVVLIVCGLGVKAADNQLSQDAIQGLCMVSCQNGAQSLKLFCRVAPLPLPAKAACYGILKASKQSKDSHGSSFGVRMCATACAAVASAINPYTESLAQLSLPLLSRL